MKDVKELIRILGSDIPGNKSIYYGLNKIKGISYSFSNAICNILDLDKQRKIGTLTDQEIKKNRRNSQRSKKYSFMVKK
ncbi:MAG: 30S ribosomal protein S13 [Candidatus Woesearchaeota archaeon]